MPQDFTDSTMDLMARVTSLHRALREQRAEHEYHENEGAKAVGVMCGLAQQLFDAEVHLRRLAVERADLPQ